MRFVCLARFHNHLGYGVLTGIQESFCKTGKTVGCLAVLNAKLVECYGDGLGGPDID